MKLSCVNLRILRSPRHVCGVALLFVLWPSAALAQEPLSWPNHAPYVRLWTGEESVLMPVDAARAAQRRLHNLPPEHWGVGVSSCSSFAGRRQRIVELIVDNAKAEVSFLVTRRSWNLLNDQNVAALNEVLDRAGRDLVKSGVDGQPMLGEYLSGLDGVVVGMSMPLDDQFIRWYFTGASERADWLGGREKRADALLRLCHNMVVTRQGEKVTFNYNDLLRNGSVVQRTVHAQVAGHRLKLLSLETVELRSAGTFSYPDLI